MARYIQRITLLGRQRWIGWEIDGVGTEIPGLILADDLPEEDLRSRGVSTHCRLDGPSRDLLLGAAKQLGLTARGYHRVLKVARTIADLAGSRAIVREHVAEALQYRLIE